MELTRFNFNYDAGDNTFGLLDYRFSLPIAKNQEVCKLARENLDQLEKVVSPFFPTERGFDSQECFTRKFPIGLTTPDQISVGIAYVPQKETSALFTMQFKYVVTLERGNFKDVDLFLMHNEGRAEHQQKRLLDVYDAIFKVEESLKVSPDAANAMDIFTALRKGMTPEDLVAKVLAK